MTFSRYDSDFLIEEGRAFSTAKSVARIRLAVRQNQLSLKERISAESERLDVIAGQEVEDASLWWVIAATSNIGWGLQVPAGTRLLIPTQIEQIVELVS